MRNSILYFFLLILEISFNLSLDVSYKQGEFSKTLSEKNVEFVLSKRCGLVALNLGLCYCQRKLVLFQRNEIAKRTRLGSMAPAVLK